MDRKLGKRKSLVNISAYVATPAYNGRVDTDYAISLADSCLMAKTWHELAPGNARIGVTTGVMGNGAFIDMARNQFVKMFLETDCTHLFFIDSDLKWEARAFVGTLLACTDQTPVIAGAYRKRQDLEEYPIRYWEEPDNPGITIEHGGFVRCDRVATGFLCIHRKVVEEMASKADIYHIPKWGYAPRLFYTQDVPIKGELSETEDFEKPEWASQEKWDNRMLFMGEDFAWCDDFRRQYPDKFIYVWPDFEFKHGGRACNWDKFIKQQSKEYEETIALAKKEAEEILSEDH